jgi:hypothetical protein
LSPGFLIGFGIGSFAGVALALLAVALARPEDTVTESAVLVEVTATPLPSTATPAATATPLPGIQTRSTLQVYIGPGELFAVVGTIAGGEEVDVTGRDGDGEWVAIVFPPNSTARAWVKAADLRNLSSSDVANLAVVAPTPLPQFVPTPPPVFAGSNNNSGSSGSGSNNGDDDDDEDEHLLPNPPPLATPNNLGPADLRVTRISLRSDGRVNVSVANTGPGDLLNRTVFVRVRNLGSGGETLIYNGSIEAGDDITLTSTSFTVTPPEVVIAIVDPSSALNDPNRSNNSLTVEVTPEAASTPRPGTGGG